MDDSILRKVIDGYRIEHKLKAGGVAVVYRATNTRNGHDVAFKLMQSGWAEHEDVVKRFQREVRIMRGLHHPHIVPYLDDGQYQGRPYIVMPFMPAGSLADRLKKVTYIKLGGTARLLAQIASALDYAHRERVVHRDLKPGNILLRDDQHAALTDFGIARINRETNLTTLLTTTGNMPGTPHYMSPEQADGNKPISRKSDLYSLGVLVYLLSVGKLPFRGDDPYVILNGHIHKPPPVPTEQNPDLPPTMNDVLLKALAKVPSERYYSASEFARAFIDAIDGFENLVVSIRARSGAALPVDEEKSRVFSASATLPMLEDMVFDEGTELSRMPRRGSGLGQRLPLLIAAAAVLFAVVAVLLVLSSGGDDGAASVDETATSVALAAMIQATTQAAPPTATTPPTETPVPPTPTQTSLPPTPTPAPTETPAPPTETPLPPTPTPPFDSPQAVIETFTSQVGTGDLFNCVAFLQAYDFAAEQVEAGNPAYAPFGELIGPERDTAMERVQSFCAGEPEQTQVPLDPPELFFDLLAELDGR